MLTTYKNPPKIPPQNIVQIFVDDFPGPTLGERARRNVVDWSFMRFYNITQEKKKGLGRGDWGSLTGPCMRPDLRELDPNSQNSPIQGPLSGVKKLIEFFFNIVEIKGWAMIFNFNFESRGEEGHVTLEIPHFLEALLFVNFSEGKVSPWSKLL